MATKVFAIKNIASDITPEFIANVFYKHNLARISSVVIGCDSKHSRMAVIYVDRFVETEAAYNFVQRLKKPEVRCKVIYKDDLAWTIVRYYDNPDAELMRVDYHCHFDIDYYEKPVTNFKMLYPNVTLRRHQKIMEIEV